MICVWSWGYYAQAMRACASYGLSKSDLPSTLREKVDAWLGNGSDSKDDGKTAKKRKEDKGDKEEKGSKKAKVQPSQKRKKWVG